MKSHTAVYTKTCQHIWLGSQNKYISWLMQWLPDEFTALCFTPRLSVDFWIDRNGFNSPISMNKAKERDVVILTNTSTQIFLIILNTMRFFMECKENRVVHHTLYNWQSWGWRWSWKKLDKSSIQHSNIWLDSNGHINEVTSFPKTSRLSSVCYSWVAWNNYSCTHWVGCWRSNSQ